MDQATDPHQNEQEIVEIAIECGSRDISCEVKGGNDCHFNDRMDQSDNQVKALKFDIQ